MSLGLSVEMSLGMSLGMCLGISLGMTIGVSPGMFRMLPGSREMSLGWPLDVARKVPGTLLGLSFGMFWECP